MNQAPTTGTPDKNVATRIVERLLQAGLILAQDAPKTQQQLAAGLLRAEDWRLLAEKAIGAQGEGRRHER
jgi:hypothetical protein